MAPRTWSYPATLLRVVDGDTVRLDLDLGLRIHRLENCRLFGIDAPELSVPGGPESRDWLVGRLAGKALEVDSMELDKYGRPLVVLREVGLTMGTSINDEMLAKGYARSYP